MNRLNGACESGKWRNGKKSMKNEQGREEREERRKETGAAAERKKCGMKVVRLVDNGDTGGPRMAAMRDTGNQQIFCRGVVMAAVVREMVVWLVGKNLKKADGVQSETITVPR